MFQATDLERSIRRRVKLSKRGGVTVHRTGAPSEVKRVEAIPTEFKDAKSGRVVIGPGDVYRSYKVGNVRKKLVRTADVIDEDTGLMYTTASPKPGMEIVNGLSDKIDSPRRVQRRTRKSKGGKKGAAGVLR